MEGYFRIIMEKTDLEKLEKRKDVIDMIVSMHSELSSTYKKRVIILDILLIILSIILLTFVFANQSYLSDLGINETNTKVILGFTSIAVSCLSLVSYVIDWRGKSISHAQAFIILIGLKNDWRIFLFNKESINYENVVRLEEKTDLVLNQCISIDNKVFNRLKKKHYMKVALSKAISNNPNLPLFLIKFNLVKEALLKSKQKTS
jgi:hypothetical protein